MPHPVHEQEHVLVMPQTMAGLRLDQALAQLLAQYSRSALKQWIESGRVLLNDAPARPRAAVAAGDRVQVRAVLALAASLAPQSVDFTLVHADDDLLVVDKPAGLVVHPGAGNPDLTLVNGLLARFPELGALPRAGLVHRIDKDTSGLLVVARTPAAYQALVRALAAREVHRGYLAVVTGTLVAGGTIDAAISRDPLQRTRMRVSSGGRQAVTHYRVAEHYRGHTLLDIELETGRTHQIRVHFAWRGHPLVGDTRYGARPRPPGGAGADLRTILEQFPRQALHARRLALVHPGNGRPIDFESPVPADLRALCESLAADRDAQPA